MSRLVRPFWHVDAHIIFPSIVIWVQGVAACQEAVLERFAGPAKLSLSVPCRRTTTNPFRGSSDSVGPIPWQDDSLPRCVGTGEAFVRVVGADLPYGWLGGVAGHGGVRPSPFDRTPRVAGCARRALPLLAELLLARVTDSRSVR